MFLISKNRSDLHDFLTIETKFFDGVINIGQSFVARSLLIFLHYFRRPTFDTFFEGGNVEVAVMEELLQARCPAGHETTVLTDRVATERALACRNVFGEEINKNLCCFVFRDFAFQTAIYEAAASMRGGIPGVHIGENRCR